MLTNTDFDILRKMISNKKTGHKHLLVRPDMYELIRTFGIKHNMNMIDAGSYLLLRGIKDEINSMEESGDTP